MLGAARRQGAIDALTRFGIKEAMLPAWDPAASFGTQVLRSVVGHPDVLLRQGRQLFQPGQPLHWRSIFWPGKEFPTPYRWLARGSTILSALPVLDAIRGRGDPHEGRLSNALGAIGGTLGGVYGGQIGGLVGAPLLGHLGQAAGKGLGHLFGSRPAGPTPEQIMATRAMYAPQGDEYAAQGV
jgi:hypothetical protein